MNQPSSATPSQFKESTSAKTHGIVKIGAFLHFARGWTLVIGYILQYYLSLHTGGIDPVIITIPFPLFIGLLDMGMSFYLLGLGRGSWEYCTLVSGIAAFFVIWNLPALFATMAIGVEMVVFIFIFLAISLCEFVILVAPWNRQLFKKQE
ncbi:MAG: hypothetical protein ACXABV_00150 [Candidatus Thorarchaeota archaeon]|jgi:hypothetical protein